MGVQVPRRAPNIKPNPKGWVFYLVLLRILKLSQSETAVRIKYFYQRLFFRMRYSFRVKRDRRVRLNQSGIGLIEVIVVAGILAVMALTLATLVANGLKSTRYIEYRIEVTNTTTEVRQLLGSSLNCNRNFGPTSGTPLSVSATNSLTQLLDNTGAMMFTSSAPNNVYGNRTVALKTITFGPSTYAGPHPSTAPFIVPLQMGYEANGEVNGPRELQRTVQVFAMSDAVGNVSQCSTSPLTMFPAEQLMPEGFLELPNGFMMQWGNKTLPNDVPYTFNFPRPFSQVFTVVASGTNSNGGNRQDNSIEVRALFSHGLVALRSEVNLMATKT